MIDTNLSVLLAERKLNISKVAEETGVSRTTLTSLSKGYSGGIKFDTLNILCQYLRIEIGDFFHYIPWDYRIENVWTPRDRDIINIFLTFSHYRKWYELELLLSPEIERDGCSITGISGDIEIGEGYDEEDENLIEISSDMFHRMYSEMSLYQRMDFKASLFNYICIEVADAFEADPADILSEDLFDGIRYSFIDDKLIQEMERDTKR